MANNTALNPNLFNKAGRAFKRVLKVVSQGKNPYSRYTSGKSSLTDEQRKFWEDNGYLAIPNFYSLEEVKKINDIIENMWAKPQDQNPKLTADIFLETPESKRIYFREIPAEAKKTPYKINDLYLISEFAREMIVGERLGPIIGDLLDGDALACNSLNFERGSQQHDHVDSFYMTPPVQNKLVASWIALENVHPDSGPLRYFPGSHKIPAYTFSNGTHTAIPAEMDLCEKFIQSEVTKRGLKAEVFCANAGDLFIWHGQLLHGGTEIKDKTKTRKSLVTHYFRAKDVDPLLIKSVVPGCHYLARDFHSVNR
ncbi:MAG: phytanoyl-CoA dioxygenase family protein [Bdellovibrionota bacterium]